MRVLGIDPGIRKTGYGVIEHVGRTTQLVDYGTVIPPADAPMSERLGELYNDLSQIIEMLHPDEMAVESTFFGVNVKSALILGQARGAALLCGSRYNLRCSEYAPRKIKLATTGNGRATKDQVQAMVQRILNLDELPKPQDAADALAVALCHLQQHQTTVLAH